MCMLWSIVLYDVPNTKCALNSSCKAPPCKSTPGIKNKSNEELEDFILLNSKNQEIGSSAGSDGIEMLLDPCSSLRRQTDMERQFESHGCNIIIKNSYQK